MCDRVGTGGGEWDGYGVRACVHASGYDAGDGGGMGGGSHQQGARAGTTCVAA